MHERGGGYNASDSVIPPWVHYHAITYGRPLINPIHSYKTYRLWRMLINPLLFIPIIPQLVVNSYPVIFSPFCELPWVCRQLINGSRPIRFEYFQHQNYMLLIALFFWQVYVHFLPVGHTHEDVDQMFSCVARHLNHINVYTLQGEPQLFQMCYIISGWVDTFVADHIFILTLKRDTNSGNIDIHCCSTTINEHKKHSETLS